MDELSFVEARQWSRHVYGVYAVGGELSPHGEFVGVAVGTRDGAVAWGRSVAPSRLRNRGVTTEAAPEIATAERTSTVGVCENDCGSATEIADPQRRRS